MITSRRFLLAWSIVALGLLIGGVSLAQANPPVEDDPLVRMPGTQPADGVDINDPGSCLRCHADYNPLVEPGFNWKGSMMTQAGRDFMLWPDMVVAAQDAMWAVGSPNATDLCERCHFPSGWLSGRSDPTNASAMRGDDYNGLTCDFCHRMYNPFFEDTHAGIREGDDWLNYWDETGASAWPSGVEADATYAEDIFQSAQAALFNGGLFFGPDRRPMSADYTENGAGQFFVSGNEQRRASFADATLGHDRLYSRYHKSRFFCSTCHDVSNPVLANLGADPANPLPSEVNAAFSYFHVERTWSEFALSAYGQPGGAAGVGPFAPDQFETSFANNYIARCQDCHMRDTVGRGAMQGAAILRPDESVEHPESGQPLHDLTGGNMWVPAVLASAVPGSPNFDQTNHDLLHQGALSITLELTHGLGIDPAALLAGADRARQQLESAAAVESVAYEPGTGSLSFRVANHTGHKLISGFPEGRRMFVNVRAYISGTLIHEVNPYDAAVGTLKGLPGGLPLEPWEAYVDEVVYEAKPASPDITGEDQTFHFVLATGRYKDNRIPPKGFDIAGAAERLIEPAWAGVEDPDYFTAEEYAGGYDQVALSIAPGADYVEIDLYYQTTSREYIAFLRDEINGTDNLTLPPEAYVVQTDPFFAQLRPWGDTIWALWDHNKDLPGAAPFLMAQAGWGAAPPPCTAPVPELLSAEGAHRQVVLTWSDEHTGDPNVTGYGVFYDQAGKYQLVAEIGATATFTDTGLTPGESYCYRVASAYDGCQSAMSNALCAMAGQRPTIYLPLIVRGL